VGREGRVVIVCWQQIVLVGLVKMWKGRVYGNFETFVEKFKLRIWREKQCNFLLL